ncbi:hypothetical protein [Sphingomonas antarctica]|uniref:hypothetical protein n=1 Tax=Sphingomonas antarctica TaxID=2040274 RepID=UPI0039EABC0E
MLRFGTLARYLPELQFFQWTAFGSNWAPAESQLDAFFSSFQLDGMGPKDDLRTKINRIYTGTISDLERGQSAEMLLGSSNPSVRHTMPDSSVTIDPQSARPMVDPNRKY